MCMAFGFIILLIAAVCVGLYFLVVNFLPDDQLVTVSINLMQILQETDEKFLSVALDSSFMRCYFHVFTDGDWQKFVELSALLSPAYLRLGGTDADRTVFKLNDAEKQFHEKGPCEDFESEEELIITEQDWLKLNTFAQKSKLNLVLDLNVLLRDNSRWNNTNAQNLIEFSQKKGLPLDFQLGNEPNSFPHVFNLEIKGKQLAQDFQDLKKLLNSTTMYKMSKIIGPDVTKPKNLGENSVKYLEEFLPGAKNVIDVVSWHQYYLNGRTATLQDFLNVDTLEILPRQIKSVSDTVKKFASEKPIWLSETGSASGGGAPKLSSSFAASFLWLDKLGVAARSGIRVVVRQSLFKGHYALIRDNFTPCPDFWISLLYKKLVGPQVLSVETSGNSKHTRFYAHCLAPNSSTPGNIVLYGLNLSNNTVVFKVSESTISSNVTSYIFKPENRNVRLRSVTLNNQLLRYENGVPDLEKMGETSYSPLYLPWYSVGFWVLEGTGETVCQ